MAALAQDALLGDRYRLTSPIATGGMGEVWRAEDTVLHRTVAVKVLKSELTTDPTFLARFRAEARTTASLSHPGIANVFDYGEANLGGPDGPQTAYLVMEYVDGEPLSAVLRREGRLPVPRTLDLLWQAAAALEAAHRIGMVHRDLKPGNLLVRPDGVVKVTDFGIARAADAVPLTQSGMVVGTAQYFSPEQAQGRAVTAASDVYSLGVVGYECLAGRLPFVADSAVAVAVMQIRESPPPLPPDVPPAVRGLIGRAMAKDPRQRFATAGEFAGAVRAVQERSYEDPTAVLAPPSAGGPAGTRLLSPMPQPPGRPGAPAGPVPAVLGGGPPLRDAFAPGSEVPAGGKPPGRFPPPGAGSPPRGYARPPRRRAARWPVLVAAAVVLLLVGAAVIALLTSGSTPGAGSGQVPSGSQPGAGQSVSSAPSSQTSPSGTASPSNPASPSASTSPSAVALVADDYVGRNVDDVLKRLHDLGFQTTVVDAPQDAGKPGVVVGISPTGQVGTGSTITVVAVPRKHRGND